MKTLCLLAAGTFALVLAGAGCSSTSGSAHPRAAPTTKLVAEAGKGTTVTLRVGDDLKVQLASTYWTIQPASNTSVLRSVGRPVTAPRLNGCVPGGGCGTVTAMFAAIHTGTATVAASRTTCGEALRCTGGNGEFSVTIVVK